MVNVAFSYLHVLHLLLIEAIMENLENVIRLVTGVDTRSSETTQRILDAGLLVYKYYSPLIIFFGFTGNILSMLVFLLDPNFRKKSSSCYLTALALSDTCYLVNLFSIWLGSLNNGVITSPFTCPLVMYINQVTGFVTVYLTVTFSVERYIAVYFPFKKLQLCTVSKAKKVILGIVTLALLTFSYTWFIAEVAEVQTDKGISPICAVSNRYHKTSEMASYLDSLFTLVIPFIAITFFNTKIARKFYQKQGKHRAKKSVSLSFGSMSAQRKIRLPVPQQRSKDVLQVIYIPIAFMGNVEVSPAHDLSKRTMHHVPKPNSTNSETRITKTLLLVSVVFLCLNLPLHVLRCAQFVQQSTGVGLEGMELIIALQPWAVMLFNTNFAVNFLLYCMSGKGFRNSVLGIIGRILFINRGTKYNVTKIRV